MKKVLLVLALLAIPLAVLGQSRNLPEKEALNKTRACVPVSGAAQEVGATAAASATSTELNSNSVYMLVCDDDAYVEWGTTSAGTVAASGNFKLYKKIVLYFATLGPNDANNAHFFAARNITANGSCWLQECR